MMSMVGIATPVAFPTGPLRPEAFILQKQSTLGG